MIHDCVLFTILSFQIENISSLQSLGHYTKIGLDLPIWDDPERHHTMGKQFSSWAWSKIPQDFVYDAIKAGVKTYVYGAYPEHLELLAQAQGFVIEQVSDFSSTSQKSLNFVRPRFALVSKNRKKFLVVAVTPGKDYVRHYAGILYYCLRMFHRRNVPDAFCNAHYEDTLASWTELSRISCFKNSIVVLGFVHRAQRALIDAGAELVTQEDTPYYSVAQCVLEGCVPVTLLGVKYSFWGDISQRIAYAVCELGAREIVYLGKLGSLLSKSDVYQKLYSPTNYAILEYTKISQELSNFPNPMVKKFPELATGRHVSISTIVEQDCSLRFLTEVIGAQSIDSEVSKIAQAVARYNDQNSADVAFSPLHFVASYLRTSHELRVPVKYDLSNNRDIHSVRARRSIQDQQMSYFVRYCRDQKLKL